ncbi:MAG: hypothetical protein M3N05_09390 [Pseudomonadota bacterium]|nr:hypothetical protein [Pseudomonadota bacterium]
MIVAAIRVESRPVGVFGRPALATAIICGAIGFTWPFLATACAMLIPHHEIEWIMGGDAEDATLDLSFAAMFVISLLAVLLTALATVIFYRVRTGASTRSMVFRATAGIFAGLAAWVFGFVCFWPVVVILLDTGLLGHR